MTSDPRKTRHRLPTVIIDGAPVYEPEDDDAGETRVPCLVCSGSGLVSVIERAEQRRLANYPPSEEQADRYEEKKP